MKSLHYLFFSFLALCLFNATTVFAEEVNYKCLSSDEMLSALADEEICSDLDITNKDKFSSCLQRKYMSVKHDMDYTYNNLVTDPDKNQSTVVEGGDENNIETLLSFFKRKPIQMSGFVADNAAHSIGLDAEKRETLIKEQTAWNESLLYDCMDAAKEIKDDSYPLLVIKGCLVSKTEERNSYLKGLL